MLTSSKAVSSTVAPAMRASGRKHGCDKGTLTVATGLGPHKEKKV